jgi:hypothetical protein
MIMGIKYLGDGGPDGTVLGKASTDLVGFWGGTAGAQPTSALAAALTAGETTPSDIAAAVVQMYSALEGVGIIAAS